MKNNSAVVLVFLSIAFHVVLAHLDTLVIAPKKCRVKAAFTGRIDVDWTR